MLKNVETVGFGGEKVQIAWPASLENGAWEIRATALFAVHAPPANTLSAVGIDGCGSELRFGDQACRFPNSRRNSPGLRWTFARK